MDTAMRIFEQSKSFPGEERFSLTDQIRRSSRSVAANISEAWRKRRYEAAFVSKLSDAESEAAETQTWIELCQRCGYLDVSVCDELDQAYEAIIAQIVAMIAHPEQWSIRRVDKRTGVKVDISRA